MIAVVGCGNPNRRDDGAGPELIRLLKARIRAGAEPRLIDAGTDGMAAMFSARGCDTLIIVDACRSGSPPGAVFEVPGATLARGYAPGLNLHDFRWEHALYAGLKIFRENFPKDVKVFLIEAASVDFGIGLSAPVAAAIWIVAGRIEALIGESESQVMVKNGSLYLRAALCAKYFADVATVILLRQDNDLLVLPVRHTAAGGYLLKRRNGNGDRVVNAPEFFRGHGIEDGDEQRATAAWRRERAALAAVNLFASVNQVCNWNNS
jgi:hydrogenase maturation protease